MDKHCAFCGSGYEARKFFVEGPKGVFICDFCIRAAKQILRGERPQPRAPWLREVKPDSPDGAA